MKVSDLKYERYTIEKAKELCENAINKIKCAENVDQILEARNQYLKVTEDFSTEYSISYVRYTLNTKDEFYLNEKAYYDEVLPEFEEISVAYANAMLESKFRAELEQKLSPILFKSFEVAKKSMSADIIEYMIEENKLVTKYSQFMSQLTFEYKGEVMALTILRKYMSDDDRQVRKEAYEVFGNRLEKDSGTLDEIFDNLVKVRDKMAKKMGYKNFVELGYYRLGRISYDEQMVKTFRKNVLSDIVPIVCQLKEHIAKNNNISDFKLYDDSVSVPGGNPKPVLDKDGIFEAAREMYHEMSAQTAKFIDMMLENDAFDVVSREGKWGGGYCTNFPKYKQPFILANFNGTSSDIDVMTHEAGHALANYMTSDNMLKELSVGGMETAETHSMSMEFFAWKYIDKFFGKNADKYKFMHAFDAISFIPYGTIVDYFQHIVYENPQLTPDERNEKWLELEKMYRPYMDAAGIPYLEKGTRWQYQMHIYETPFYYIDYCMAQTVAFEFLIESLYDYDDAFKRYFKFLCHGGELTFSQLIKEAQLSSPFEDNALKVVGEKVKQLIMSLEQGEQK